MTTADFYAAFDHIEGPRASNSSYPLTDLTLFAFSALLCGAQDWTDVFTITRLKADSLARALLDWAQGRPASARDRRQIALDGKAHRGTRARRSDADFFSSVSAHLTDSGFFLATTGYAPGHECAVAGELLERVEVRDALVTLDALHTGAELAGALHERGADWLMPIKANHPTRRDEIERLFESPGALAAARPSSQESVELGHGRIETRSVIATRVGPWFGERGPWPGIRAVVVDVN